MYSHEKLAKPDLMSYLALTKSSRKNRNKRKFDDPGKISISAIFFPVYGSDSPF
jgi:hypothetical protein